MDWWEYAPTTKTTEGGAAKNWWEYTPTQKVEPQPETVTAPAAGKPGTWSKVFNWLGQQEAVKQGLEAVTEVGKGLDWMKKYITEPTAAYTLAPFYHAGKGIPTVEEYREWRSPWGVKGTTEFTVDPLNLLMMPQVKGVLTGVQAGIKAIPAIRTAATAWKTAETARITEMVTKPSVQKLMSIAGEIKKLRPTVTAAQHAERVAIAGRMKGIYGAKTGEKAYQMASAARKGELTKSVIPEVQPFTAQDLDELYTIIQKSPALTDKPFSIARTQDVVNAIQKVLLGDKAAITPSDIKALEEVFGKIFVEQVVKDTKWYSIVGRELRALIGVPRTLVTSLDASAPLMQGAVLAGANPEKWAQVIPPMLKAWTSKQFAEDMELALKAHPWRALGERAGVDISKWGGGAAVEAVAKEEPYMMADSVVSKLVHWIPGVSQSERSFSLFTNKLRLDTFGRLAQGLMDSGKTWEKNADEFKRLANFVNDATGRASLGKLNKYSDILSATFFAPKLLASRFTLPLNILASPQGSQARAAMATELAKAFYNGMLVLGIAKANGASVELDPRSSDFGKIKIGNTRMNYWGGYQPIIRYMAQLFSGQQKATTGTIIPRDRLNVASAFIQSKFAPALGIAYDITQGKTFTGEEVSWKAGSVGEQAFNRLCPLFIQDMVQAARIQGLQGAILAAPAGLGASTQTYKALGDVEQQVSQNLFQKRYEDLNQDEQRQVQNSPEVQAYYERYRWQKVTATGEVKSWAFDQYKKRKGELEKDLKSHIEAGMAGEKIRETIQNFKRDRYTTATALLTEEIVKKRQPNIKQVEDLLAEQYWSIELEEDPRTGALNFAKRDAERLKILDQAKALGVDIKYITGSGEGTFRGERFEDPVVARAVEEYEYAQEILRPYWDLQKRFGRSPQLDQLKRMMRMRNPMIDAMLVKYYEAVPIRMQLARGR